MERMRRLSPLLTLGLAVSCLAGCTSTVQGNGSDPDPNPDATPTVTPDFPDAAPPVVLPDAEPVIQPCLEGDIQVTNPDDGTCYMLLNGGLPHIGAQAACIALGANLVVIETAEEQAIVATLAVQFPTGLPDVWIGATDVLVEGTFVWVNLTPVVYDNWRDGEPNNGGDGGEDCAVIEGDTAANEWDDRSCLTLHPAICER
jgi:hypothetical protein